MEIDTKLRALIAAAAVGILMLTIAAALAIEPVRTMIICLY